ncbi:hypothetical protein [Melissococcus plutonius]|uniref:hypothetical protein n=1 Tax=Melissococcus plutonius TaxID=33970 RepID=UPI0021E5D1AE|nr:hypothetical protein [Melissococcus plutonius]
MWKTGELNFGDLSSKDKSLIRELYDLYPMELIDRSSVISVNGARFIIDKNQLDLVTDELKETLEELSTEEVDNPIFISIEDGVITVED